MAVRVLDDARTAADPFWMRAAARPHAPILDPATRMVRYYSKFLHATWLGWAAGGGITWFGPVLAVLHLTGIVLLMGAVGAIDLRILGVGKGLALKPLQRLLVVSTAGFVLSLLSGVAIYAGDPARYQNGPFLMKMLCLLGAGLNALLFYTTGLSRRVNPIGAGEDAPAAAKISALASLVLWFAVIFWGRILPFVTATI
jgi:hypothetical protein